MKSQSVDHMFDDACNRLTREVREHPLLTLGVAVGVGAVLGALSGRTTALAGHRKSWLASITDDLSENVHEAGNRALRTGVRARRDLHATANRASNALPDIDIDHLVSRGRHWLRTKLA